MQTIFTIGYEGTDIDRFVATLADVGVEVLVDVRAVTVSRKKGFSKNGLRARLEAAGIKYVHLRGLGDPKPGREAARAGRYDEFRTIYDRHLSSPEAQADLAVLGPLSREQATCLMCFERDPKVCHRSMVALAIGDRPETVFDLFGDVPGRYRNASIRKGRDPRQGAPAAEQDLR
ncbi:DUF488 family protein [Methylobacterium phyllostachyos]|uniref:DUF488 domain-containing protein n=1 Tax=Methylobacterium phyllostachyos TaxID=582672 RepID=UPI000A5E7EA7|nr:DUF488 domain-containing protein [Methylobacterium phyllostachyos]